jgi:superoxide dismutase, Cu-Zn family
MKLRIAPALIAASALALAACADNEPVDPNADTNMDLPAPAELNADANAAANTAGPAPAMGFVGGDGTALGSLTLADTPGGLSMTLAGTGMPPGVHGLHLHTVGKCEGPKFESAGPHWNPDNKQHGTQNPQGPHKGDLPNVTVAGDGSLNQVLTVPGVTLAQLQDGDGTALIVHAAPDDNRTDPSGNSGDRIACVVVAPAS